MCSYLSPAQRVPADHPLRSIRALTDDALRSMSEQLERLYSTTGRPAIPPEQMLRAVLLPVRYTVRSERLLIEELDDNLLFRWFVGLNMDDPVWPPTPFTKHRDRLLGDAVAAGFFDAVSHQARAAGLLSDEHVTVDDTHQSTTDPQARLYRQGAGREAASWMLAASVPPGSTVGGDTGYDVASFVDQVRALEVTPHIALKARYSALDGRTTRHPGYEVSQRKRTLVEPGFGGMQTDGLRELRHRGGALVDWNVTVAAAADNLVRLRTLVATWA